MEINKALTPVKLKSTCVVALGVYCESIILFFNEGKWGVLVFLSLSPPPPHSVHFVIFTLSHSPHLSGSLSVTQLVSPFCLFSLSHPLFSRDALKLLVFHPPLRLALHRSKLLWTMCPG